MMNKTLEWVKGLELPEGGIAAYSAPQVPGQDQPGLRQSGFAPESTGLSRAYPEVSGYLIPTFYDYGETAIAVRLAEYLLRVQDEAGWFPDMKGKARTFDTGACMEGLGRAYQETARPDFQEGATRAWDWLESMELESGALRVAPSSTVGARPGSDKTHVYTMRVSGLMGNERAAKYWKDKAWDGTRVHYAAYALEGMWMVGEEGFVIAQLLLARRTINKEGLMPYEAGSSWRIYGGSDACATAQMAILYWKAGMEEDARQLEDGVRRMVRDNGSVEMGLEHTERNSWTAKWVLDMETLIRAEKS